jgi:hypothetical protein
MSKQGHDLPLLVEQAISAMLRLVTWLMLSMSYYYLLSFSVVRCLYRAAATGDSRPFAFVLSIKDTPSRIHLEHNIGRPVAQAVGSVPEKCAAALPWLGRPFSPAACGY